MQIQQFAEAATPAHLRAQVTALRRRAWPSPTDAAVVGTESSHDPGLSPTTMLLVDERRVIGALDILSKAITHVGRPFQVSGLSAVVTDPDLRGHGYGHRLITAAHRVMAASGVDLSIFTCDRPLQGFYERSGWHALRGSVIVGGTPDEPFNSDQEGFDKVTMADFFSAQAILHRASFMRSRIYLYPGEIDRLW